MIVSQQLVKHKEAADVYAFLLVANVTTHKRCLYTRPAQFLLHAHWLLHELYHDFKSTPVIEGHVETSFVALNRSTSRSVISGKTLYLLSYFLNSLILQTIVYHRVK